METNKNLKTMLELSSIEADNLRDEAILTRIKNEVTKHLPKGWEEWKVCPFGKDEILGEDHDPQILNRIRFAIPTIGMALAFNPKSTYISEKSFKEMKLKMLDWPFCVGLIVGPSSVSNKIRGSAAQNELILAAIRDLKQLMLSRKEANKTLGNEVSESEGNTSRSKRSSLERETKNKSKETESRLDRVENMISTILEKLNAREEVDSHSENHTEDEETEPLWENEFEEEGSWAPPSLLPEMEEENMEIDFRPITMEQEPSIPAPKPAILQLGKECQRLGTTSFNKIRYSDVHKKTTGIPSI